MLSERSQSSKSVFRTRGLVSVLCDVPELELQCCSKFAWRRGEHICTSAADVTHRPYLEKRKLSRRARIPQITQNVEASPTSRPRLSSAPQNIFCRASPQRTPPPQRMTCRCTAAA